MNEIIQVFLQFILDNALTIATYCLATTIVVAGALTLGNKFLLWIIEKGMKEFEVWPEIVRWVKYRKEFQEWLDDKPARKAWERRKMKQEDSEFYKSDSNAQKINEEGLRMDKYAVFKVNAHNEYESMPKDQEFFVLRLDGMNDPKDDRWFWACRKAINVFANEIEPQYPQLAEDIRKKWPYEE